MASITIRKIDVLVLEQLRAQAVEHGRTMEEEARSILCKALIEDGEQTGLTPFLKLRQGMAEAGIRGVNLRISRRTRSARSPKHD